MADGARFDPSAYDAFAKATDALTAATSALETRSRRAQGKALTFHLDISAPGDVTRTPRGVLKYIHNPNVNPVTLRLVDLVSRRILWAGVLAAGDQAGVYAPFASGIDCTVLVLPAGSDPIILAGDYDANE
jgi:hypothetical protein